MSRQSRLEELARNRGPKGESTQENIDYWARRAERNSYTGGPRKPGSDDSGVRAEAKSIKNDVGSKFMPGVRRGNP